MSHVEVLHSALANLSSEQTLFSRTNHCTDILTRQWFHSRYVTWLARYFAEMLSSLLGTSGVMMRGSTFFRFVKADISKRVLGMPLFPAPGTLGKV